MSIIHCKPSSTTAECRSLRQAQIFLADVCSLVRLFYKDFFHKYDDDGAPTDAKFTGFGKGSFSHPFPFVHTSSTTFESLGSSTIPDACLLVEGEEAQDAELLAERGEEDEEEGEEEEEEEEPAPKRRSTRKK